MVVSRAGTGMLVGHNPYLVALSVVIAIMGGYTGFALAARVRGDASSRRPLLAGAAMLLAVSIWTMHFIGMLAAPLPVDAVYLALPTIVSFLICALVVGMSLFFVSVGEPSTLRVVTSAALLGLGIVSMHYVGVHGVAGDFEVRHNPVVVVLAAVIAIGAAYGGLRIFLARQDGTRLALSAVVFGIAVSGMHYTAMRGMAFVPLAERQEGGHSHAMAGTDGLVASPQALAIIVALLCFLIVAAFLLLLVPDPSRSEDRALWQGGPRPSVGDDGEGAQFEDDAGVRKPPAMRVPVEGADGTHLLDIAEVRSIKADAHYTLVHDGQRERLCPWSISEAEAQLNPAVFIRVHRSHIISLPHVSFMRKEGESAVVELDGAAPHLVPVSRPKIAELRARLGLLRRAGTLPSHS